MPKKAVATFFLFAFLGAALFIFFTFPRTKDQIPTSNNQRPFPSAPAPPPPAPDSAPVPENVPHPNAPKVPPGPNLRVMAWATAPEARALEAEADAFSAATGRQASLTLDVDPVSYRRDLRQAIDSDSPPDVVLVSSLDFSGLDPSTDLAGTTPAPGTAPRAIAAFTVDQRIRAAPAEFSATMLFYNQAYFDQAGIAYPGPHWTWDIMEADARALQSLQLKDAQGQPIWPLELAPDFDLWNILCTEAGHPALDLDTWHLGDTDARDAQMRGLEIIHDIFRDLEITAPAAKAGAMGAYFAQQRAALFIGPYDRAATLPPFRYGVTVLPRDLAQATSARVNGWAVTARSDQTDAARILAAWLAAQPVHAGWMSTIKPKDDDSPQAVAYQALGRALVPRLDAKTARLRQVLDRDIALLARDSQQTTDDLYAKIQTAYQRDPAAGAPVSRLPDDVGPAPKADGAQLRGF